MIIFLLFAISLFGVEANLNYGDYYSSPVYPQQRPGLNYANEYDYPQVRSRIGTIQNRPPSGTVYWPAAMLNAQGQTSGINPQYDEQIPANFINDLTYALVNALTSALFPRNQQQRHNNQGQFSGFGNPLPDSSSLPLINLIPSAGINLGPSQQYGYGSNMGVYAGIQGSQTGYNYNYNNNGQPINRPYGPTNTNIQGSYGGLSQWPFIQPTNGQSSNVVASTMSRPRPTQPSNTRSSELNSAGTVRTLSIQDLINESTTKMAK